MPDTGEDREIRQRVNAKEAEIESESTKLSQKSKDLAAREAERRRRTAGKKTAAKKR
jgi:hypothetical protein